MADEENQEDTEIETVINHCPACREAIDVTELAPFSKIECPHCAEPIRVRTVLGNYQIVELLGEGGMSQVFRAEDMALNRHVALKILHQNLSRDTALMAQFEREAQITASINHPNVVKVYTVGSDQGYFFIAMELIDNVSLEKQILAEGAMSEAEVLEIAHGITNGLRAAFNRDLIHRDIKPGNILLTSDGTAKLVDFGLAVVQGGDDETEDIWATPFYVPPEKLEGQPDDFRGDIYSLGATFYHTLVGRPPFEANTSLLEDLIAIKARPISLAQAGVSASQATVKLIDRMMAYKPSNRYQNYEDLLRDIERAQDKLPATARAKARRSRAFQAESRSGVPGWLKWCGLAATALVAVALLASVVGGVFDDDIDADLETETQVLSAGEKSAAARYVEARNFLVTGKHREARDLFNELLESGDLKEPTVSWARINAGLATLMGGDEKQSRAIFQQLLDAASKSAKEMGGTTLDVFFAHMSYQMAAPLPVMPEAASDLKPDSVEAIALLAYGLKNWDHQQFDSAMTFFQAFADAGIPNDYAWMEKYRDLTGAYRKDLEIIRGLPNPRRTMPEAELKKAQTAIAGAAETFQTTGAAPRFAKMRVQRADQLLALLSNPPAPPMPDPPPAPDPTPPEKVEAPAPAPAPAEEKPATLSPAETADRDRLLALAPELSALSQTYRFPEAAAKIEALPLETPFGKSLKEDGMIAYQRSEAFVGQFVDHMAQGSYDGTIRRKKGPVFQAKVTSADREKIAVDLGFGANEVPVGELAADWMLEVADEGWIDPAGDSLQQAAAVWFAWCVGLKDHAEARAAKFQLPPFQERWKRLAELDP